MDNDIFGLTGKVAVVTGAANGIGKATVTRFAQMGAKVVVCDIQQEAGQAVAKALGDDAMFYACEVGNEDQTHEMMDAVVQRYGRLDILMNNAGARDLRSRVPVDQFPPDAWRHKIDVDVSGTFYCSQAAVKHMVPRGSGCIINTASIAGVVALRLQIAHDAAKAAIIRMSQAMALELGPKGIRVNSIAPGSTLTEGTRRIFYGDDAMSKDRREQLLSFIPLGRPAEPEDIANGALYLASDLASYVTGFNLIVDGGWTAGYNRDF